MTPKERLMARLNEIIAPQVEAMGFDLVRVMVFGKTEVGDEDTTLQIMAERPDTGQLVIADCAALSHRISDAIDAAEEADGVLIEEAYRLEVSSPGIDRPLTRLKDFTAWAGHEAKVNLVNAVEGNRKALQGDILGVEGELIALDDRKSGRVTFALDDIHAAKLVLTDRLLAATKPIDASGVDDLEEDDELTEHRDEKWEPVFGSSDATTKTAQED